MTTTTEVTLAERARAKGWPDGLIERALAVNDSVDASSTAGCSRGTSTRTSCSTSSGGSSSRSGWRRAPIASRADLLGRSRVPRTLGQRAGKGRRLAGDVERAPDARRAVPAAARVPNLGDRDGRRAGRVHCLGAGQHNGRRPADLDPLRLGPARARGLRREGLGDLVRRFPSPALRRPSFGQVMYLRLGNANMAGFLEAVKFQDAPSGPSRSSA